MKQIPEGMEIKQLISLTKQNWYWFLIAVILGLVVGILYNKSTNPIYQASTSILIKTEDKNAALKSLYKDLDINDKATSIQNQVAILSSYNLNLRTLESLKWDVSWFEHSIFKETDLYQQAPFNLVKAEHFEQTKEVPLYIKILSDSSYELSYNSEVIIEGKKFKLKNNADVNFGKPFINDFFNFKITRLSNDPISVGDVFILLFNDIGQLALAYQSKLDVKLADKDAEVINVKLDGDDVSRSADYLNELGRAYILFGLSERDRMADNTIRFIDSLILNIDSSLQTAGNQYTAFRTKNRVLDFSKEATTVIDKAKDLDQLSAEAQIKLDYYENLKKYLNNPAGIKNLVAPSIVGVTDPTLNSLVLKLTDLFSQREVQSYTLQEKNPKLISLDNEIKYTQRVLAENINNLLSNTQLELNNLNRQKDQLNRQQATLPKIEQNYISIKRNFDLNSELYNFLMQRRAEAGIIKASHEPEALIIDPARKETAKPIGHYGMINLLIGIVAGLLLAFLVLLLKNYFDNRIRTITEVTSLLDLPVSGIIKHNKLQIRLPAYEYPHSAIAESFRDLRTQIYLFWGTNSISRIIAINSSISREGKSFVSCNLACMLAMDNKNVLLVDMDLRKPDLHTAFRFLNKVGLSDYLKGEADFDEILSKSPVKGLTLITTGPFTDYPSELLHNRRLETFFEQARKRFDYIIIKNPPSSLVSDPRLIDKYVDLNIFLLKFKHSTKAQVDYINDLSKMNENTKIMVVLNNVGPANGLVNKKGYGYYIEDRARTD